MTMDSRALEVKQAVIDGTMKPISINPQVGMVAIIYTGCSGHSICKVKIVETNFRGFCYRVFDHEAETSVEGYCPGCGQIYEVMN